MSEYTIQVGEIRGRPYHILVSSTPSYNNPEEFAVVLFYNDPDLEERVQIARIDTAHDYVHIDRLFSEEQDAESFDGDMWDAVDYLEDHWERFASLYRENHED